MTESIQNKFKHFIFQIQKLKPEFVPTKAHEIKDYGPCPYFNKFRIGTRDLVENVDGTILPMTSANYQCSLARESIGTQSNNIKIQNFEWLMNKKLTCGFMWIGVIVLIVGVITLQISGFFQYKRQ